MKLEFTKEEKRTAVEMFSSVHSEYSKVHGVRPSLSQSTQPTQDAWFLTARWHLEQIAKLKK